MIRATVQTERQLDMIRDLHDNMHNYDVRIDHEIFFVLQAGTDRSKTARLQCWKFYKIFGKTVFKKIHFDFLCFLRSPWVSYEHEIVQSKEKVRYSASFLLNASIEQLF